jgi:DnaJ domain
MIVWGHGRRLQTLGPVGRQECQQCGQVATIFLGVLKKQFTLYWVPVARWNGEYYLMCGICNASARIDKALGARMHAELDGRTVPGGGKSVPPRSGGTNKQATADASPPTQPHETFYDLLGVAPDATDEEIRRSYRIRAQLVHPDHHAGAADEVVEEARSQMGLLNQAWEVLRDSDRRAEYDATLGHRPAQRARPSTAGNHSQPPTPGRTRGTRGEPRDGSPPPKPELPHVPFLRITIASLTLVLVVVFVLAGVGAFVHSNGGRTSESSVTTTTTCPYAAVYCTTTDAPVTTTDAPVPVTQPPPWYPADFFLAPGDRGIAYKFLTVNVAACDYYSSCWNISAIPRFGCPTGISVAIQVVDPSGSVVGSASGSVSAAIGPGQSALLKPTYYSAGGVAVRGGKPSFTCY